MTEPSFGNPPSCSLWVDGVRFADGQPGEDELSPVALTGLKVTWGRDRTIDQPSPSTASFDILDTAGGQTFKDVLHLGSRVDVRTDATIYPDPSIPIIRESFAVNAGQAYTLSPGLLFSVVAGALQITAAAGVNEGQVIWPPAALTDDPSGWNAVPRTRANQTWQAKVRIKTTSDLGTTVQTATLRPVTFTNPNGQSPTQLDPVGGASASTPGWAQIGPSRFIPPVDVWMGLAIDVDALGPRWVDVGPAVSWASLGATPTWQQLGVILIDDIELLAPAAGTQLSGMVFSGLITDLDASYELHKGGTVLKVIAQDWTADLGNRYVGDEPWAAGALGVRFGSIINLSGQRTNYTVDPGPFVLPVTYRDVDSQSAYKLLEELAISAGGALWSATNLVTGPYLWLEDIDARPALWTLYRGPDMIIRIKMVDPDTTGIIELDACSVLLEPIHWAQATDDDSTRVVVTWLEQITDDDGKQKPTSREVTVIDASIEAATGVRRVGISSELSTSFSAQVLATKMLNRLRTPVWRITGLTIRLGPDEPLDSAGLKKMMAMLDGTTRLGLPLLLTDLPGWSPIAPGTNDLALYIEGGELTSINGYWTIELKTTDGGIAGASVTWLQIPNVQPPWSWDQFDPAISWANLSGVTAE